MKNLIYWVEIPALNFSRAVKFYSQLLQAELVDCSSGNEKMAILPDDAGAIFQSEGYRPSKDGLIVSLNAGKNLDEWLKRVVENGGSIDRPKTKIEAEGRGWFALFIDSEGNRLGLYGE
jgi:predicted enzyme related to lactoylglutathione lyase